MGTEFLHPQDCLIERIPAVYPHRKSYTNYTPTSKSCRKQAIRPDHRQEPKKRIPQSEPLTSKKSTVQTVPDDSKSSKNLVMGQVTILKRGESLDSKKKPQNQQNHQNSSNLKKSYSADMVVYGTERLGPDPEMVPKEIRIGSDLNLKTRPDVYAGSAFSMSPSPRALPLPTFSVKKGGGGSIIDDSATKDLRRMLGLE